MVHKMQFDVGEGLFADGPVDVPIEFPSCTAIFKMLPLTADILVDLESQGVTLSTATAPKESLAAARILLQSVVVGWEGLLDVNGKPVPYTPENRDKLAGAPSLIMGLWKIASNLAARAQEEEEGN